MSLPECDFYVGIDWAAVLHAVCVMDAAGKIVTEFRIEHTAEGFAALLVRLGRLADDPMLVTVALERPDGRLVDALLEAGYPLVPVSPNAIKTWRDGEVLSGAKSDAGDAAVIAEYLRLRSHRLRPATPFSAQPKALRTVVRTRDDIVAMRTAATNQLTALLDAHWPGAGKVFADIESPIALEFLTRYPTAKHAAGLGEKRMHAFCVKHGYSGRRPAAELLARLRTAPPASWIRRPAVPIRRIALASKPESVGYDTFAGTTVVSARTRLVRNTFPSAALASSASFSPLTAVLPHRVVSFINVVGCGTAPSSGIRQNRRQVIESLTSRHSDSYPNRYRNLRNINRRCVSIGVDGRPIRGSKNGSNWPKNTGSSSNTSTPASSSGNFSNSGGRTASHSDT